MKQKRKAGYETELILKLSRTEQLLIALDSGQFPEESTE